MLSAKFKERTELVNAYSNKKIIAIMKAEINKKIELNEKRLKETGTGFNVDGLKRLVKARRVKLVKSVTFFNEMMYIHFSLEKKQRFRSIIWVHTIDTIDLALSEFEQDIDIISESFSDFDGDDVSIHENYKDRILSHSKMTKDLKLLLRLM